MPRRPVRIKKKDWIFEEAVRGEWRPTGLNLTGQRFYEYNEKFTLHEALRILSDIYQSPFRHSAVVRIRNIYTNEEINGEIFS